MSDYYDLAIPIAWPDQTARGDEAWMKVLKKIGLVKNLNFRIGHAAIVLIERKTGAIHYADFGRYITPRGMGRARTTRFDPALRIHTRAEFNEHGEMLNLEELLSEMESLEAYTHGAGRLVGAICEGISFAKALEFAEKTVEQGLIPYGALAPKNNSCSRYVAQILAAGLPKNDPRVGKILYPEFIKPSPMSNVVNAPKNKEIFILSAGKLIKKTFNRRQSFRFQIQQLLDNFTTKGAKKLGPDHQAGWLNEPERHPQIPHTAQWLGGIGEGKWFALAKQDEHFMITRYGVKGTIDYQVFCAANDPIDLNGPYEFTYDLNYHKHVIIQGGKLLAFSTQMPILRTNTKQNLVES